MIQPSKSGGGGDFTVIQITYDNNGAYYTIPEGTKRIYVYFHDCREYTPVYVFDTTFDALKQAGQMTIQRAGQNYYARLKYISDTQIQAYADWYRVVGVVVCS